MVKRQLLCIAAAALASSTLAHAQTSSTTPTPNVGGSGVPAMSTPSGIATNPSLGSPGMALPPSSVMGNAPPTSAIGAQSVPSTGAISTPDTTLPGTLTTPGLSTLPGVNQESRSAATGGSAPSRLCAPGSIFNPC